MKKRVLLGIDDTDNAESRGTGFRARQLGKWIESNSLGEVHGITRHQLLFDSRIPYTSHNSSACLDVLSDDLPRLTSLAREFLLKESAEGSDAGLALCPYDNADEEIIFWGLRAKREILTQAKASEIAEKKGVVLEGLTGDWGGIIGSLAAVGLRKYGDDGRFLWLKGKELRDLKGLFKIDHLMREINIDSVQDVYGNIVSPGAIIDLGEWVRPVLLANGAVIIADRILNNSNYEWRVATKDYIKRVSD